MTPTVKAKRDCMSTHGTLSTEGLQALLEDHATQLVDVRSPDAYNGWALQSEPRGGHIPGARSLPATWTAYLDWPDIAAEKGFQPSTRIVLYGNEDDDVEAVAHMFGRDGFREVLTYPRFEHDWLADARLPLERLERFRQLVPPAWLRSITLTNGGDVSGVATEGWVLCHCHYRNEMDYDVGHIPGAISLDTLALESPETWNRRALPELTKAMEAHGITSRKTVVLYGRDSVSDPDDPFPGSKAGQLAAMRCAFLLLYTGVGDVRVLNGGLQAWEDAGYETTTRRTDPSPVGAFGGRIPGRPDIVIDTDDAKVLLAQQMGVLVDVRSRPEFEGIVTGYNYIHEKGRIPGAVFANGGSDAYHLESLRNPDGTALEHAQIARTWEAVGLSRDTRAFFFCGTGWRASEAFWNAWLMGWSKVGVYDGGWFEWSNDPRNPTETGRPS